MARSKKAVAASSTTSSSKVKKGGKKGGKKAPQKDAAEEKKAPPRVNALAKVLHDAQRSVASHKRGFETLAQIQTADPEAFVDDFVDMLKRVLVVPKKEPSVDRLLTFFTKYATRPCEDPETRDQFAEFLMRFCLEHTAAADKQVRGRVCQIVAQVLNNMPENAEINEEIYDEVCDRMMLRTRDKIPHIRAQAAVALSRLQDPTDMEDPVLLEYIRMMEHDSCKDVRKAAVQNIGVSMETLPYILRRSRDTAVEVRKMCFDVVTSKVDIRSLSIKQRVTLLKNGIDDREDVVQRACRDLCNSWLLKKEGDVIALLKCFNVENFTADSYAISNFIINNVDLNKTPSPPYTSGNVTPESVLYWRVLCETLKKQKKWDMLDHCVPSTFEYVELVDAHKEDSFIAVQLVKLAVHLDFCDQVGRRKIEAFLKDDILKCLDVDEDLVPEALVVLRRMETGERAYVNSVMEVVHEVHEPLESVECQLEMEEKEALEDEIADLQDLLVTLQEKRDTLVQQEEYELALGVKKEIRAAKQKYEEKEKLLDTDFESEKRQSRELTIIAYLLASVSLHCPLASFGNVLEDSILPGVDSEQPFIRNMAIKSLGTFCLMNKVSFLCSVAFFYLFVYCIYFLF